MNAAKQGIIWMKLPTDEKIRFNVIKYTKKREIVAYS